MNPRGIVIGVASIAIGLSGLGKSNIARAANLNHESNADPTEQTNGVTHHNKKADKLFYTDNSSSSGSSSGGHSSSSSGEHSSSSSGGHSSSSSGGHSSSSSGGHSSSSSGGHSSSSSGGHSSSSSGGHSSSSSSGGSSSGGSSSGGHGSSGGHSSSSSSGGSSSSSGSSSGGHGSSGGYGSSSSSGGSSSSSGSSSGGHGSSGGYGSSSSSGGSSSSSGSSSGGHGSSGGYGSSSSSGGSSSSSGGSSSSSGGSSSSSGGSSSSSGGSSSSSGGSSSSSGGSSSSSGGSSSSSGGSSSSSGGSSSSSGGSSSSSGGSSSSSGGSSSSSGGSSSSSGGSSSSSGGTSRPPPPPKKSTKVHAGVLPSFYLDFDWGLQIVNLARTGPIAAKGQQQQQEQLVNPTTLQLNDDSMGYAVTRYDRIEAGIGPALKFWAEHSPTLPSNAWVQVGIVPFLGKELVSKRFAPTRKAAHLLRKPKLPEQAALLRSWNIGDQMTYTKKGGVFFYAGPGYIATSATLNYLASGLFEITVKKVNENSVWVQVAKSKLHSLSGQVQAGFSNAGIGTAKQVWKNLSFLINVDHEYGCRAYDNLIRGYAIPAQNIAANMQSTIVTPYDVSSSTERAKFANWFIGIPILLNMKGSAGNNYNIAETKSLWNNQEAQVEYNVYMRDFRTRALDHHTQKLSAFYGSTYRISSLSNNTTETGRFGQLVWLEKDDHATTEEVREMIASLVRRTGLRNYLHVDVPDLGPESSFAQVAFKMTITPEQSERLITRVMSLSEKDIAALIANRAMQRLEAYHAFANSDGDIEDVCSDVDYSLPVIKVYGDGPLRQCFGRIQSAIESASEDMAEALMDLRHADTSKDLKEFNKAYSLFGKAMLKNQFMFRTGMELVGEGAEIKYSVTGEAFAQHALGFMTTSSAEELQSFALDSDTSTIFDPGLPTDHSNRGVIVNPGTGGYSPIQPGH